MVNERVLIIGGGESSRKLIGNEKDIRGFFDIIIGVGGVFKVFDNILDVHIVTEKHFTELDLLNNGDYRTDLLRLVNFKSLPRYNKKYNLSGVTRSPKTSDFSPSELMDNKTTPALLVGPVGSDGSSLGSVLLSAIHYAATMSPAMIYLVGAEFCFTHRDRDHFYEDGKYYRNQVSKHPNSAKYEVRDGVESTGYFFESAPVVDRFITNEFSKIQFYNFSEKSLLKAPMSLNFDEWLKKIRGMDIQEE